ncbi:MAG TPA: polysaccharide biosynthesis/export family protein [Polyangia bacterium]|nr:polysaccharide biosynthesis/export family protein [Polyangia bacterium]
MATRLLPSPIVSQKDEFLDPKVLADLAEPKDTEAYKVGPGDTLLVAVFNHPELAIAAYSGSNAGAGNLQGGRTAGYYVDNNGEIQFPLIGSVPVAGKTSEQLRVFLEQALAHFVRDPKVVVQVIYNGSIRYYLIGQFTNPGLKYADRPMHLLEAVSLGGSIVFEKASLSSTYIARAGKKLPINFSRLLRDGDLRFNIWLMPGDAIVVPDNLNEQAFVFGGAAGSNARGGAVPFFQGHLDILQALAQAGIGFRERTQGRLDAVRVIRSEADRGRFFVIDVEKILRGEAASFALAPGDIVFIPATALTTWNEAIQEILPSLQTVAGLLEPFVQIKFLSQ